MPVHTNSIHVFTPEQKQSLRETKRRIARTLDLLAKAEKCGRDCQRQRDQLRDTLEVLDNIEREFMRDQ